MTNQEQEFWSIEKDYFEHKVTRQYALQTAPGLTEETIRQISQDKQEPQWMLDFRLKCFELYKKLPMPNNWPDGPDLKELDLNNISYYVKPGTQQASDWNNVPPEIKKTFERLGIPEAERHSLAGAGAQFEAEVVYHNLKKQWEDLGVIFTDCDIALKEHEELFKKYFMKCVPPSLHKFAALHGAVWSGGTFIYIPKGVKVDLPLQAYFRMNVASAGQFEHTLIIVDEGAEVSYIEGCFTKGTKIITNPDFKPIEKIQIGDKVLTHTGEFKKVYHIHERPLYDGDLYKIKIWGDSTGEIECTKEHPFLRVKRERANERNKTWIANWTQAQYINHRDYLLIPINRKVVTNIYRDFKIQFKNKNDTIRLDLTKDFFRLIGYYLAEGSVSKNSYLNFSFGSKEREYIDDVKKILKNMGITSIHEVPHNKNNGISVVVGNAKLARVFKEFGSSASTKGVPLWILLEEPEKQREMLIGLFRGDGNYFNVKYNKGLKESLRLNTVSEKLAHQTRDILFRLNIVSFINKRIREKESRQTMYTVGITGEYMYKMGGLLGIKVQDRINNKKRATMFYLDNKYAYVPIRKITKKKVKGMKVYNFAVENDESYTVNGVTVHNCSAPTYTTSSLHAGCVEIFVHKGARARYSSMENWAKNVFNLNTKRAIVDDDGVIEWVNGNMGSKCTMLYPCSILKGKNARADFLGVAVASKNQFQDTGAKVIHAAPNTSSTIRSKSISKDGGITTYRGLVHVAKNAANAKVYVQCDALMLDNQSKSNTVPYMDIDNKTAEVGHEATVSKIGDEQLFYAMSRGLSEEQARQMIVSGFIEPIIKALPIEYAVEFNRLIELEMENALG